MAIQNRASQAQPTGYRFVAKENSAEIYLYGPIGDFMFSDGVSAKMIADDLKKYKNVNRIDLRMNSEGGDVFDGMAMYTLLSEHHAKVVTHVDGLAASAASYVAMAGDEIRIAESAFFMIHNPWTMTMGGGDEHRAQADLLDSVTESIANVYVARTGADYDEIRTMMNEETWMSGNQAVSAKFADVLVENKRVAASVSPKLVDLFHNLPAQLKPRRAAALRVIEGLSRN